MKPNEIINPNFPASIILRALKEQEAIRSAVSVLQIRQSDIADVPSESLYVFSAEISNNQLDSYFTKMAASSLKNYAQDANDGVAFMNSHKHSELPLGYSVRGEYIEGDNPKVIADFYTVRGMNLNGLETDQFIQGVQFGLIRDVSIGFSGGTYICSVCSRDLWDWDCSHIPGITYAIPDNPALDPSEQTTHDETCFAWIEDARLSEVSAVFDGATPSAMITKATREAEAGRLQPKVRQALEYSYRVKLPDNTILTTSRTAEIKENTTMGKADETSGAPEEFSELFSDLRSIAKAYGFKILRVTNAAEAMTVIEALTAEVDRLKPFEQLAETGLVLRERLTAETVKEGIRAFGKDFNSDEKTKMLDGLDVDTISQLRDSWKAIGDSLFAGNKRVSEDEVEKSEEAAETEVPPVEPLQTGAVEDEVEDDDIEIGVGV